MTTFLLRLESIMQNLLLAGILALDRFRRLFRRRQPRSFWDL